MATHGVGRRGLSVRELASCGYDRPKAPLQHQRAAEMRTEHKTP
jgi:hypothetical protein